MIEKYDLSNENLFFLKEDNYYEHSFQEYKEHDFEGIHIYLSLKGVSQYDSMICDHLASTNSFTSNIDLISKGNQGVFNIPKNTYKQALSLFVPKDYLLKILSLNKSTENVYDFFEQKLKIKNIKNKKLNPKSSILVQEEKDKQIVISKQAKEAIFHAQTILSTNLENPPSIKKLAQMVALNEFKLKYGFNKFFIIHPIVSP